MKNDEVIEQNKEPNALNTLLNDYTQEIAKKDVEEVTTGLTAVTTGGIVLDYNYFMESWYPLLKEYFFDNKDNGVVYKWYLNYRDSSVAIVANYNPNVRNARELSDYGTPILILPPLKSEIKIDMQAFNIHAITENSVYEKTLPQRYDNVVKDQVEQIGIQRDNSIDNFTYDAWCKGLQHLNPDLQHKEQVSKKESVTDLGFEY